MLKLFCFGGLPAGESLFIVGLLDSGVAISRLVETFVTHYCEAEKDTEEAEDSVVILYPLKWLILCLMVCSILLSIFFWTGGLIVGNVKALKIWGYSVLLLEFIIQSLSWLGSFCNSESSEILVIFRFSYIFITQLLIRLFLVVPVFLFLKRYNATSANNKEPSQSNGEISRNVSIVGSGLSTALSTLPIKLNVHDVEKIPVGSGLQKISQFYCGDINRLARTLLTVDLVWSIYRILEREVPQLFHSLPSPPFPQSSYSPVFTEERIIRLFRMAFDLSFLRNLCNSKPPLNSGLILPKIIEILVSCGILIFVRFIDISSSFSSSSSCTLGFNTFYILFVLDIIIRISIFGLCYKLYGDYLCTNHRRRVTAVANKSLKKSLSVI